MLMAEDVLFKYFEVERGLITHLLTIVITKTIILTFAYRRQNEKWNIKAKEENLLFSIFINCTDDDVGNGKEDAICNSDA